MSQELLEETILNLQKTFQSADKKERENAELRLKELEGDLLGHLKMILDAIKDESLLKIKSKISSKSLTQQHAIEILKCYIDLILTNTLSNVCLLNLTVSLQDILNYKIVSDNKNIAHELVQLLHTFLENNLKENIFGYRNIISVFENILLSSSVSNLNGVEMLNKLFISIEFMFNNIFSSLKSLDVRNNIKVFLQIVEIISLLFTFLHTSVIKMRTRLSLLSHVLESYNTKFIPIAMELILMTIPGVLETNFIAFTSDPEFDTTINGMKAKALKFVNSIVQNYGGKINNENLIKIYGSLVQASVQNLDFLILNKYQNIQELSKDSLNYPDYNYETIIYQILLFLGRILCKEPFLDNFASFSKQFAANILIPLLVCPQKEIEQMKEDGEEYTTFIADLIDDHKGKTIKCVCAFALQNMSEKFDGFASYVVTYLLQLVDYNVLGGTTDKLNQETHNLLTPSDRIFILINAESQIETAFLIFSILTSSVLKNKILINLLKNLFEQHFRALMSVSSDIIKDRICLFIGIYIDYIYEPQEENFKYLVEFLFLNLFYYNINQGVAHKAADSLNDLVSVKKFSIELTDLISKYMPQLIQHIPTIKIGLYFDVLLEIVLYIDVQYYLVVLMKELVARVLSEIAPFTKIKFKVSKDEDGESASSKRKEKEKEYQIIVNKCFNIIRTIADKAEYVQKYILDFEIILEPIFKYMETPSKIEFDEDLVLTMTSFIKNTKTIPESGLRMLPNLPKYLKKSKGLMLDLYELVNQYIVYGVNIIDVKDDYNKIIMKIYRASFDRKCEYDKSAFLGSNLMQVWLCNSAGIPYNMIKEIISLAINEITYITKQCEDIGDLEIRSDVYTFISLLALVFSGFINYPIATFEAILMNNDLDNLQLWCKLFLDLHFFSPYQTKTIILGVSSFFKCVEVLQQVPGLLVPFLNFLLALLNKQKNEESKNLKQTLKQEINCNFIDSDEEDNDSENEDDEVNSRIQHLNKVITKDMEKLYKRHEEEYDGYTNEREIKDICERTINPIKTLDEYEYFKNCIEFLNSFDHNIFKQWAAKLSDKERINLNNLIHTRRIVISNSKINATVPRKVIKIKRDTPDISK